MSHLKSEKVITGSKFTVFEYMTAPEKLAEQMTGIMSVSWQNPGVGLQVGSEFLFLMTRFGIEQPVRFVVDKLVTGHSLTYHQMSGLYAHFVHTIKFEEHGLNETLVTDLVEYELPFGLFGRIFDDFLIRADLKKMLSKRLDNVQEYILKGKTKAAGEVESPRIIDAEKH